MSIRISTAAMHDLAVAAMLRQQAALSQIQNQVASGKRVQTPADDPVAAAQLYELARTQSQVEQFNKNSAAATGRLQLEEQGLADAGTVLQRVRELVVQANTATLTDNDRGSIVTELRSRITELQDIANRKDSNGEYLFAGYSAATQPFVRSGSGAMGYFGDAGVRQIQINAAQYVHDGDAGSAVFMDIAAGNGVYTAAAAAANGGSGVLDPGSVVDRSQWVPDNYSISFTSTSTWQVTDSASNIVASGNYIAGGAVAFRGVQLRLVPNRFCGVGSDTMYVGELTPQAPVFIDWHRRMKYTLISSDDARAVLHICGLGWELLAHVSNVFAQ